MRVSFLELYNEELFDLLGSSEDALRLKIYEDSAKKVTIKLTNQLALLYFHNDFYQFSRKIKLQKYCYSCFIINFMILRIYC